MPIHRIDYLNEISSGAAKAVTDKLPPSQWEGGNYGVAWGQDLRIEHDVDGCHLYLELPFDCFYGRHQFAGYTTACGTVMIFERRLKQRALVLYEWRPELADRFAEPDPEVLWLGGPAPSPESA